MANTELEKLDRYTIDLLKGKGGPSMTEKLLMVNSKMWILEDVISDQLQMEDPDYYLIGRLYAMLRNFTNERAKLKGDEKTY